MKLTTSESIQENEKEFIDTINAELDWEAIERMLLEKHGFVVQEDVDYKDGNLVVHNNEIAYKFDFEIKVPLSVIFNRAGECLEMSTQREDEDGGMIPDDTLDGPMAENPEADPSHEADQNPVPDIGPEPGPGDEMASEIADMISQINED